MHLEEFADKVPDGDRELWGKSEPAVQDALVRLGGILLIEGRVPGQHFIHQNTKRPPVYCLAMPLYQVW